MSGKTNILVTQEVRKSYSDKAVAHATETSNNDEMFVEAAADFDAEISEESTARERLQREGNMTNNETGTVAKR